MKSKKLILVGMTIIFLTFVIMMQNKDVKAEMVSPLKQDEVLSESINENNLDNPNEITLFQVGISSGYYKALGDVGNIMKPGISLKGFAQYHGIYWDSIGVEFELGYAEIEDKDYDGQIRFIWGIPSITYCIPYIPILTVELKVGVGLTHVKSRQVFSNVDYGKSSLDLTPTLGIAFMKSIYKRYISGVEVKHYYYLESKSAKALDASIFVGMRL
ncbi:MAG: hypothetical protein SVZ03_15470 [Spirochaetota bacterium]|nr:hypothetical protein [Spirochaetota bacterium]